MPLLRPWGCRRRRSQRRPPAGDPLPNHRAGKLRLLATSGKQRLPFAPDVPTFAEQGFGELTTEEWFGFYAPAKTPAAVLASANAAINAALKDKSLVDGLAVVGLLAKKQLASTRSAVPVLVQPAAGVPDAGTGVAPSANVRTQSQQVQQQYKQAVEGLVQQPRPMPDDAQ